MPRHLNDIFSRCLKRKMSVTLKILPMGWMVFRVSQFMIKEKKQVREKTKETNRVCKDVAFPNSGGIGPIKLFCSRFLLGRWLRKTEKTAQNKKGKREKRIKKQHTESLK